MIVFYELSQKSKFSKFEIFEITSFTKVKKAGNVSFQLFDTSRLKKPR